MVIATKYLFNTLLRNFPVDCVCDIGSRDGEDSLNFREILPESEIIAFEANEINYERMLKDNLLIYNEVKVFPYAISNKDGTSYLNIIDPTGSQSRALQGMSSLMGRSDFPSTIKQTVLTKRLDNFMDVHFPHLNSFSIWIDVEGHEYEVIQGISGIREKVLVIHVETAIRPLVIGQHTFTELNKMLNNLGFIRIGKNFKLPKESGDAIYINATLQRKLGYKLYYLKVKAFLANLVAGTSPSFIKKTNIYKYIKRYF